MARKLDKSQWRASFDAISKVLPAKRVEIEVASLRLGDQVAATSLPLIGISYDPKDDLIEVALEGVDYLIHGPREVWLEGDAVNLSGIEVIDADGVRQIIGFRDPLMLPSPRQAARAG